MIVDYQSRKNEVLDAYTKFEEIVSELQDYAKEINWSAPMEMDNLMKDIQGKAEKVKADRFIILVAGESKSGKSTFINAYLGVDELLPMAVEQCTSSIVEIKYGDSFSVRATYAGGKIVEIKGDEQARAFLKENAALDDAYRDIPVPTINSEILVKAGLRAQAKGRPISISEAEVSAMLSDDKVQAANIHHIPDYNERIRKYIEAKKDSWQDITVKIEVMFPFNDELRGIEIIDSPGICARGGVSEITKKYSKNADAIIFLKPVIGQALEADHFNDFMEEVSNKRNKDTLFLVLTHIATKTDEDICTLESAAYKMFSPPLDKNHILFVDSKAELYANNFREIENIKAELDRLDNEQKLDGFLTKAYFNINGINDTDVFIEKLKEISRFEKVYRSLETFGRKAHYLLLAELLASISNVYEKLLNYMKYQKKADDPIELAQKVAEVKQELDILQNKLGRGVSEVVHRFQGDNGEIRKEANRAVDEFLSLVKKIDPESDDAFNKLERASIQKINLFEEVRERLQCHVVEEFDKQLIALSDKKAISFVSLKPNFTSATFKEIKESTQVKATETEEYEDGITFTETKTRSIYVQNKHFKIIKNSILDRLECLKNDLTINLEDFVENIRSKYITELKKNADAKNRELDTIMEAQITAEQNQSIIDVLSSWFDKISKDTGKVKALKGGIDKCTVHQ